MPAAVYMPKDGTRIGTYGSYAEAQRAVDYLSDNKFPVENTSIIGSDLRMVEQITGRLTWARAAIAGAATGAWFGLFVGLLLGLFSPGNRELFTLALFGLLYGAVFGLIFGLIGYAATRGRRDFTSTSQVVASTYDVMCLPSHAQAAQELLAKLSLTNPS
ncbi:MAG: general stress protein [Geodermatophilaceae bacterium]